MIKNDIGIEKFLEIIPRIFNFMALIKVGKFQNEFMKSPFLPKYEPNLVRLSAQTTGQKSLQFLVHILGEMMTS